MAEDEAHDHDSTAGSATRDAAVVEFRPTSAPTSGPRPKLREVIGEVLREERHAQGRTLADVAEAGAVSLPYLSEVERGRKEISSDLLEAVTGALDLDLPDLLERAHRRVIARSGTVGSTLRLLAA